MTTSPSTPVNHRMDGDDDIASTQATQGTMSPPDMPTPIVLRRQNAFELADSSQQSDTPTHDEPQTVGVPGIGGTGEGNDSDDMMEGSESDDLQTDSESDQSFVLLGDNSDSDPEHSPKERVKVRMCWIRQSWREIKDHNRSFRVGFTPWPRYLRDQMIEHGYQLKDGQWTKAGELTKNHDEPPYAPYLRKKRPAMKKPSAAKAKAKAAAKVAAKKPTIKKVIKSMKKLSCGSAKKKKAASGSREVVSTSTASGSKSSSQSLPSSPGTPSVICQTPSGPSTPQTPAKTSRSVIDATKSPLTPMAPKKYPRKASSRASCAKGSE